MTFDQINSRGGSTQSAEEPLSAVDAAWLRMDRPTNLMMVCGMMLFAERVDLKTLKFVVGSRMLCFHRFRQRVAVGGGAPRWESDPNFDIDWHVRRIGLPDGGHTQNAHSLEEIAGDLISTPLDPTKPMWQFHLIDGVNGGSAILIRIHHCYGDGFALMHVIESITDIDPGKPRLANELASAGPSRGAWERVLGPVTETVGDTLRAALAVADLGRDLFAHPARAIDYARIGADLAYEAAVIAGMTPDSATRLKGALGVMKRTAWSKPLSLLEAKAVAQAFECSVNDVLVSCATGALRNYLLEQGEQVEDAEVRALVPVNLRPPGPITELGNCFGLVFLSLPIGIEGQAERVREVHERMEALKRSQQPRVALGILAGMGVAPDFLKERVLEALAANASAVITNMRGPDAPRYIAGKRIARQMFWVPQSGGIGIGLSILSYAGAVSFGVVTDARRVPNPDVIAEQFTLEFETVLLSALMMPWPESG